MRWGLSMILLAAFVGGCEVGPNYHSPQLNLPAGYSSARPPAPPRLGPPSPEQPVELAAWWQALHDPELNKLIDRAVAANPDLHIAKDRLQEAREAEAVVTGDSLPAAEFSLGAGGGSGTNVTKGRVSQPLNAGTNTTGYKEITQVLGFDAAWEVDLFGQLRRESEAVQSDSRAAFDLHSQVLITLLGDVARGYLDVRTLQARVEIARQNIAAEESLVNYSTVRFQRGLANELDAALAERELAAAQSVLQPLQAQLAASKRAVAVLIGEFPEDLGDELDKPAAIPDAPVELPTGLPAELLRRRPDVLEAENQMIGANARIGVATANLYPQIFLTAGYGWQGQGLGRSPVKWNDVWSIGPAVRWALFDFGTLDAAIQTSNFQTREALWNYRKTVINAVREVDDALQNYDAERDRLASLSRALVSAQRAYTLAQQRYDRGIIDFLNVLDAQRQLFTLQDELAQSQEETATQFVALCKALGGGWEGFAPPPPPPPLRPAILAVADDALHPARPSPLQRP
jgi:NodT family efflux transporter outer membrane factor (OMF) lipoprotein